MANYSEYNEMSRFENLDGIEWKIIDHLIHSHSRYAELLWKILKYPTIDCLMQPNVSEKDRMALIDIEDGGETTKRVFLAPFLGDAWTQESSTIHIYVNSIQPITDCTATVSVAVDTVTHVKLSKIVGDYEAHELDNSNPLPNPNDGTITDQQLVLYKSRATTLLKSVLAELSGLYIDGAGYLQLLDKPANKDGQTGGAKQQLWNGRSYFGHTTTFNMTISGASEKSVFGF